MKSARAYEAERLAWAARSFAHSRCLANQAVRDGLSSLARTYGEIARADWARLSALLAKEGAL